MGRMLGRSGIEVSDVGFGCWAIGGPFTYGGRPDGWVSPTTASPWPRSGTPSTAA